MSNIGNILKNGSQILKLEDEWETLSAITTVADRWSEISISLTDFTSVIDFFQNVEDEIERDDIKAVFDAAGLEKILETLKLKRKKIGEFFKETGIDSAQKILHPLSRYSESQATGDNGLVRWSLIDAEPSSILSSSNDSIDYNFDLGGSAALELESGALWPYGSNGSEGSMVRFGVEGKLSAKAKFKVPFKLGSVGASAAADGQTHLDYYFEPSNLSPSLGGAATQRILHLPNPFDLKAVVKAYNATDFYGYDMTLGGGLSANVDVVVGHGLEIANIGKLAIEAGFRATLIRRRKYQISLKRLGDAAVNNSSMNLVISGHESSGDGFSVGIDIVLDFTALAQLVHSRLSPFVDQWDDVLNTIKPYLKPGTFLLETADSNISIAVDKLIGDKNIKAAVVADLQLLLGTRTSDDLKISKYLSNEIAGALDSVVSSVLGNVEAQAKSVLESLKDRLPGLRLIDKDSALESELSGLINTVSTKLEKEVKSIANSKPKRKKVAAALGKLGIKVSSAAESADKTMAKVRKLIDHYDSIVKDVMSALSNSAYHQVKIGFSYSELKTDDSTVELDVKLSAETDPRVYRTLLSGDFSGISRLINKPVPEISIKNESLITRIVEHQSKFGGQFVGFGISLEFGTIFSGKAKIAVDGTGNVNIVSTGSAIDASATFSGEKTKSSFIDVLTIARAKVAASSDAPSQLMDIGLSMNRTDKALEYNEFKKLVKDMRKPGLLSKEGANGALEKVNGWLGGGSKKSVPANLGISLQLDDTQVRYIIDRGAPDASDTQRSETIDIAIKALLRSGDLKKRYYKKGLMAASTLVDEAGRAPDILLKLAQKEWSEKEAASRAQRELSDIGEFGSPFYALHKRVRAAWSLVKLTEELNSIYTELPAAVDHNDPWDLHKYAAAQKRIAKHTKLWLATGQWGIIFGDDGLDRRMAAFFIALGRMAGLSEDRIAAAVTLKLEHRANTGSVFLFR